MYIYIYIYIYIYTYVDKSAIGGDYLLIKCKLRPSNVNSV